MDIRYVWNWGLLRDFNFQKIDPFWTITAIQGYMSNHIETIDLFDQDNGKKMMGQKKD